MSGPDIAFWQQRFDAGQPPWDRGGASPRLSTWLAEDVLRPCSIAVPGCGSGHEVAVLAQAGFDVTAIDYAPGAVSATEQRLKQAGVSAQIVQADVLDWQPASPLDAIYEQTCLCALHPDHWVAYGAQLHRWLRPGGQLALLAMQALREGSRAGRIEGPPYHVDIHALRALLPSRDWDWPRPPFDTEVHPTNGWFELALVLHRR